MPHNKRFGDCSARLHKTGVGGQTLTQTCSFFLPIGLGRQIADEDRGFLPDCTVFICGIQVRKIFTGINLVVQNGPVITGFNSYNRAGHPK